MGDGRSKVGASNHYVDNEGDRKHANFNVLFWQINKTNICSVCVSGGRLKEIHSAKPIDLN